MQVTGGVGDRLGVWLTETWAFGVQKLVRRKTASLL